MVLPSLCYFSASSSFHPMKAALLISSLPPSRVHPKSSPLSRLRRSIPGLELARLPPWDGLKPLARPLSFRNFTRKEKGKFHGKVVRASLFGVGAPEALVIGVVALLVFGPKGLAEVARNLGKTLRAFQPTIRELQEVSKDFKSTLEREIGIDEVVSPRNYINKSALYADEKQETVVDSKGKPLDKAYTREELLKVTEPQLAASDATSKIESTPESQDITSQVGKQTSEEQAQEPASETLAATTTETIIIKSDADTQSSEKSENQR